MGKVILVAGLLALGCGSSDGGPSAPDECEAFVQTYCGHAGDCIAQVGCDPTYTRDQEKDSCVTAVRQTIACGNAKAVGPSYSACMKAASSTACTAFGTATQCATPGLPADCEGVILF